MTDYTSRDFEQESEPISDTGQHQKTHTPRSFSSLLTFAICSCCTISDLMQEGEESEKELVKLMEHHLGKEGSYWTTLSRAKGNIFVGLLHMAHVSDQFTMPFM